MIPNMKPADDYGPPPGHHDDKFGPPPDTIFESEMSNEIWLLDLEDHVPTFKHRTTC